MTASSLATRPGRAPSGRSPLLRLTSWWRRESLDRRLASGDDPATSADLTARAEQLLSAPTRRRLAADVERLLEAAERPPARLSSSIPICRDAVQGARPLLLSLAGELDSSAAVRPQGVALTRLLLSDGGSPVYEPCDDWALVRAVEDARAGLAVADAVLG